MTLRISSMSRRVMAPVYFWIAGIAICLVLGGVFVYREYLETYHYAEVDPDILYRCGFRTLREFNTSLWCGEHGRPAIVISLLDGQENLREPFNEEAEFVRRSHMKYRSIPIKLGGWPTTEQVRDFLNITTGRIRPSIVHCAQGVRRTGMMVAAYQMSVLHWDKEKTKSAIMTFGHSDRTVNDIKRFIDVYDPATRTVTQQLEQSTE